MSTLVRSNGLIPSNSFFDDFLTKDLFNWSGMSSEGSTVPKVNIMETNDEFRVAMAAPGMKKEDFQVELDNDMLTITSELTTKEKEEAKYSRREFSYQSFKRSFYLPNTVEADKIEASYSHGLLSLVIPKKEEAKRKPIKTISIS
jgi:HSP20 family protein